MIGVNLSKYKYIVGYGIGQYFDYVKTRIPNSVHLDYLCDAKWESLGEKYDNIPVISPKELEKLEDVFVIIFAGNRRTYKSIGSFLDDIKLPYIHADKILDVEYSISGKRLKELGKKLYKDGRGNVIEYCMDIEDTILITFCGDNNHIKIGHGVRVGSLRICSGNNSNCYIGQGTEIEQATIFLTEGSVTIGKDCLFSCEVVLRNHDAHHIFDRKTGKRINYSGDISIGDHVWIGYGVTLLGNASVGNNSIVGTRAVTSSNFPKEVIIAGNPAKIIRENVCWSKDNTNFYNREYLKECLAQEAYKYFENN